jgi:N-acyl-D-amino-acid deacylase
MLDFLIQNSTIIDGSGAPAYIGSVGLENGKIRLFTQKDALPDARERLDGAGLTVTPGFIDAHSHGDLTLAGKYATLSKINQGITSQVCGQCGVSMFPVNPAAPQLFARFVAGIAPYPELPENPGILKSAAAFMDWMQSLHNPVTTYTFVGHGTLRLWAMGYENRIPDGGELKKMQDMLRRCMREGALGLSTGLVYAPSCYAKNEELLALLRVVAEEGGKYATHPRNEADRVVEARRESIMLAREAGVPLCVSHLKAAGKKNWGKPHQLLLDVDAAVQQGQRLLVDCYPYMAGNTALNVSIPPRYFSDGLPGLLKALRSPSEREIIKAEMSRPSNYDNYIYNSGGFSGTYVSSCPVDHAAEGMFITEYARKAGMDPFDAYCDILLKNGGLGLGIYFHMSEDDVAEIIRHPLCVISTDGLVGKPNENPHPRSFGTMGRAYTLMVRERSFATPEQAVRKMSGQAADFLALTGKGYVREGYDGDLLIMNLSDFTDTSTYAAGNGLCAGLKRVYAGGKCVYNEGELL